MNVRSLLGSLQLPIAAVGTVLVVFAVGQLVTMNPPPPGSEGFVHGLALIILYVLAWVGFVVLSMGLAIPPKDGYGIAFTRRQRGLFVTAAVAAVLSAVGPFVAFGLIYSNPTLLVSAWLAVMSVAIIALAAGLIWRGAEAINTWRATKRSSATNNS